MHLSRRIIYGDAARLFLLLLFRIVGGQIGRDALPGLAMIARAKQKLRADVDRSGLRRAHVNRRVPVITQLTFFVARQRLDAARFMRLAIDAADVAALRFGVDIVGIGWIGENPETIAAVNIFPATAGK